MKLVDLKGNEIKGKRVKFTKYVGRNGFRTSDTFLTDNYCKAIHVGEDFGGHAFICYPYLDSSNFDVMYGTLEDEKLELEVGKWYKQLELGFLYCVTDINECNVYGYGVDAVKWCDYTVKGGMYWQNVGQCDTIEATDKEVDEALIKEAKRRGFKEGGNIGDFNRFDNEIITSDRTAFYSGTNQFFMGGACILEDGKWAELIKDKKKKMTVEEIEEQLGYKVKIVS